jgi:hypothetical protein
VFQIGDTFIEHGASQPVRGNAGSGVETTVHGRSGGLLAKHKSFLEYDDGPGDGIVIFENGRGLQVDSDTVAVAMAEVGEALLRMSIGKGYGERIVVANQCLAVAVTGVQPGPASVLPYRLVGQVPGQALSAVVPETDHMLPVGYKDADRQRLQNGTV